MKLRNNVFMKIPSGKFLVFVQKVDENTNNTRVYKITNFHQNHAGKCNKKYQHHLHNWKDHLTKFLIGKKLFYKP